MLRRSWKLSGRSGPERRRADGAASTGVDRADAALSSLDVQETRRCLGGLEWSCLGSYERMFLDEVVAAKPKRIFEYWRHEASGRVLDGGVSRR